MFKKFVFQQYLSQDFDLLWFFDLYFVRECLLFYMSTSLY